MCFREKSAILGGRGPVLISSLLPVGHCTFIQAPAPLSNCPLWTNVALHGVNLMSSYLLMQSEHKASRGSDCLSPLCCGNTSLVQLGIETHRHWGPFPICTVSICAVLVSSFLLTGEPLGVFCIHSHVQTSTSASLQILFRVSARNSIF